MIGGSLADHPVQGYPAELARPTILDMVPRDVFDRVLAAEDYLIRAGVGALEFLKIRQVDRFNDVNGGCYFGITVSEVTGLGPGRFTGPKYATIYDFARCCRIPRVVIPKAVLDLLDKPVDRSTVDA